MSISVVPPPSSGGGGGAPTGPAGGALDGTYPDPDLASALAGAGLGFSTNILSLNVDDSSVEVNADTLRVKALGITNAMLAGSIDNAKLATNPLARANHTGTQTLATISDAGTIASQNANNVTISGGSVTGITDLAVADGGTGASTAGGARTNLDVPSNAEAVLDTLVDAKGDILTATAADTPARLAVGTNAQILSADSTAGTGLKWVDAPAPTGSAGGALDGTYPNPGLNATVAGNGLAESSDVLSVNVDGSTLEISSDSLRVKDDGVTYAKLQNVSATDRLLGRDTAAAGNAEELTVGGGVEFTGSGGIQTSAFTGDVTKSAGGTATTIANDAVTTAKIANDQVTYAKLQNVSATDRLLGRDTAAAGDAEELTVGGGLEFTGSGGIQRSALTSDVTASAGSNTTTIANNAVTYAKMQDVSATDRLIGRDTAGSGDPEELTVTGGVEFSGSGGIRRSALTGDVTAAAGSNATSIASGVVTDTMLASPNNPRYHVVTFAGVRVGASAGTGVFPLFLGSPANNGTTNTIFSTSPSANAVFYFDPADYAVAGKTTKCRVDAICITNATAPGVTLTVGMYPVSTPVGGAGANTVTQGTVTAGSTVAFTTPALSTMNQGNSGDFTAPAAGFYALAFNNNGTTAANSATVVSAFLKTRVT